MATHDESELGRIADELCALPGEFCPDGLEYATDEQEAFLARAAGELIFQAIEAGGLGGRRFAGWRLAIRQIKEGKHPWYQEEDCKGVDWKIHVWRYVGHSLDEVRLPGWELGSWDENKWVACQDIAELIRRLPADSKHAANETPPDNQDPDAIADSSPAAEAAPVGTQAGTEEEHNGKEHSPLEAECLLALQHYSKRADCLDNLSVTQQFCLICAYWKDTRQLTPAEIRKQYVATIGSADYPLPNDPSGTKRVKTYLKRGYDLIRKLPDA